MFDSRRSFAIVVSLGLVFGAVGCGDKGDGAATGSAKPATSAPAAKSGTAANKPADSAKPADTAKPAEKPVEMVDIDLESADPKWKGWTAKGPSDAKVLADGVNGARIAAKGPGIMDKKEGGNNGFDMAFAWGKTNLKELKTNLEKGAAASSGKQVLTFTTDTPDVLEWKSVYDGKSTSYSFVMHMNVEKQDITCKNNYMVGSGNEAEHKSVMEACKTLAKKK